MLDPVNQRPFNRRVEPSETQHVLLNSAAKHRRHPCFEVTLSSHPLSSAHAFGLLARLQPVLQRSLHLGSACDAGVQQQAGSSGGAQVQGVFPSLGEQEDSGRPGTLWRCCRHLGDKKCKEALFQMFETSVLPLL